MKITKFVHSCLLVEMPAPTSRTVLFDPGAMSVEALPIETLEFLDDIIITHEHGDHIHVPTVKALVKKFPNVRITSTKAVVDQLKAENIAANTAAPDGVTFFDAPHEHVEPLFPLPEQKAVHYLDLLTNPGDSHSFAETKKVLALPITGPWGSTIKAVNLALELKPQYIIPIHDWHWREEARQQFYNNLEVLFNKSDITFLKMQAGEPIMIEI
ncbi:MAG: MBL fold metallo-hydrolase [Patescibacteria group bacterium]|nr:MBL fold metallo-hydrolase [Patescibacteria group bacterium]